MSVQPVKSSLSRVWLFEGGVSPAIDPEYQGQMKIGDSTYNFGDITKVEVPDPNKYDAFESWDEIQGASERPTTSLQARYSTDLSRLLELAGRRCPIDVQVHLGKCRHPQDFERGWEKIRVYPSARISSWADENAGAMSSDERNPTNETVEMSAEDIYEFAKLKLLEKGTSVALQELTKIRICDTPSCGGDCGDKSDGKQRMFVLRKAVVASGGDSPDLLYSEDGMSTWGVSPIDSLTNTDTAEDFVCAGDYIITISTSANGLEYATLEDILAGTEVWTEVLTGFVAVKTPNAMYSSDGRHTWIVGEGGYIYFTSNPGTGVEVQEAGSLSVQGLNAIAGFHHLYLVVVGDLNVVEVSENGGEDWSLITGPEPGANLLKVAIPQPGTWVVLSSTQKVWYTTNDGVSWAQTGLPIVPTALTDVRFVDKTEGYLATTIAGPKGLILRSINGGRSWYVLPEETGASIPNNDAINSLAVAAGIHNLVVGVGLSDSGTAGFMVKGLP